MPGHSGVPSCALLSRLYYKIVKKDSFCKSWSKKRNKRYCKRRSILKRSIFGFKAFGLVLNKIWEMKILPTFLEGKVLWQQNVCPNALSVQDCPGLRIPYRSHLEPPWLSQQEELGSPGRKLLWETEKAWRRGQVRGVSSQCPQVLGLVRGPARPRPKRAVRDWSDSCREPGRLSVRQTRGKTKNTLGFYEPF